MVAERLDALTPRTANQRRALLINIFNHAAAKGLCPDNPVASTINRIEKKLRKRHTVEVLLKGVMQLERCSEPNR